ncbi:hypothetical protein ACI2K4_33340 [Micromonospora sp. NPDC050397]|uniref:hypothetical protein n=1 Tax=Micromonospora sp. NPDC050397 TaxID=3364279 RepID=UPI00384C0AF6
MTARRLASSVAADLTHKRTSHRWDCGCGRPWPCEDAREELAVSFAGDRIGMATYMAERLVEAARDLRGSSPAELYDRFILWTR